MPKKTLAQKVEEAKKYKKEMQKTPPSIYSFGYYYQLYKKMQENKLGNNALKYGNYSGKRR